MGLKKDYSQHSQGEAHAQLHPRLVGYHELEGNAEIILLLRGIATPLGLPSSRIVQKKSGTHTDTACSGHHQVGTQALALPPQCLGPVLKMVKQE